LLDFLADIDVIVRDFGKQPLTLVGHSMGAVLAAMLAGARPDVVSSLVLIECPMPSNDSSIDISRQISAQLDYVTRPPSHPVFPDVAAAANRLRQSVPALSADWSMNLAERITTSSAEGVSWRWDARLQTRAGMFFSGGELSNYVHILNGIQLPVTLVYASDSHFVNSEQVDLLHERLHQSKRITLRGGHNLHLEASYAVADIIAASSVIQ